MALWQLPAATKQLKCIFSKLQRLLLFIVEKSVPRPPLVGWFNGWESTFLHCQYRVVKLPLAAAAQ